jgi:predicted unusual protein kinase regulating ubiquinone biosynthesis (AarF/ABC1/UbiB family)
MKGAAMKLGQVMSFLDVGLVPEEYREEFQRKLGELRDAAPKVRFSDMRKVIESELGEKLADAFDEFDETPIAAASIGQVYRARLHDGRDVAVKVQYPGVAQAVRADMQNLGMILRLLKRIAPGLDVKATAEEVRSRIGDELDYELEAQNQRSMARIFRGHPFIVVPDVVTALTREKVIVSEFVSGLGFDAIKQLDQPTRNRVGETVFRFYFGCMYRHHQFSGDPHPGNFLLMDDGKVAFLDFGLFKVMPASCSRSSWPASAPATRATARSSSGSGPRPASSSTRRTSAPTSCSRSSATRPGGTCSTRTSSSCPRSPRRS